MPEENIYTAIYLHVKILGLHQYPLKFEISGANAI